MILLPPSPCVELWNSLNSDFKRLFRFYSFNLLFVDFEWFPVSGRYCISVSSLLTSLLGKVQNTFFVPAQTLAQHDRHVCNAVDPKWNIVEFLSLLYFLLPQKKLCVRVGPFLLPGIRKPSMNVEAYPSKSLGRPFKLVILRLRSLTGNSSHTTTEWRYSRFSCRPN